MAARPIARTPARTSASAAAAAASDAATAAADDDELHELMDDILTRTANALHGQALKDGLISWHDLPERAEGLRQERDAARREVCAHLSSESALLAIRRTPEEIAASRGWLCFPPDNTPA